MFVFTTGEFVLVLSIFTLLVGLAFSLGYLKGLGMGEE